MTAAFQLALISSMYGRRIDLSRRGPLICWAHQRQENLIDNLLDSIVRQGLEGHQGLVACKVRRKRHNPRGEAGSGDLTTINRAPQNGLHDVRLTICALRCALISAKLECSSARSSVRPKPA